MNSLLPPKDILRRIPKLYATQNQKNPMLWVKYFTPWTSWTWYVSEFDGTDTCFGYVVGFDSELGYFSLNELEDIEGPNGLHVERDIHWTPKHLYEVMKEHNV